MLVKRVFASGGNGLCGRPVFGAPGSDNVKSCVSHHNRLGTGERSLLICLEDNGRVLPTVEYCADVRVISAVPTSRVHHASEILAKRVCLALRCPTERADQLVGRPGTPTFFLDQAL